MSFNRMTAYLTKNSLTLFNMLLGAGVLARLWDDIFLGRWSIHAGAVFPYRHPGFFPIYGQSGLLIEWALILAGGVLLFTTESRKGALLAAIGLSLSLSQMIQNQKILLWIILWIVALTDLRTNISARKFLKWQLILVYLFTGLSKVFDQFSSGETLQIIALHQLELGYSWQEFIWQPLTKLIFARVISWLVIAWELLIPLLFLLQFNGTWLLVLLLHGGLLFTMKDLSSFSFAMFALTTLFYCPDVVIKDEDLTQPVTDPG